MKKICIEKNLTTLQGIIENYILHPNLYQGHYKWIATRFDPFWRTLSYADNTGKDFSKVWEGKGHTDKTKAEIQNYKSWYMKCAIIDINKETNIQEDYATIWFDLKGKGDKTIAICQLGKGSIRFEIEGNIPKLLKGKEKDYVTV